MLMRTVLVRLVTYIKTCSDKVKNHLFKTYCSNAYGSVLWSCYNQTSFKRCVVSFNDIYRHLFNVLRGESMSHIFVTSCIDSFNVIRRKNVYSFRARLLSSFNGIIRTLVMSEFYNVSPLTVKWNSILYL